MWHRLDIFIKFDLVFGFAFFLSFVMICSFVMLNLFVLVIIDQFEKYYSSQDNPIDIFKENLY